MSIKTKIDSLKLSDLYYILDLSSPIEELHKILSDEV